MASNIWDNLAAAVSVAVFALFVVKSRNVFLDHKVPSYTQREFATALRTAVVYIILALPPLFIECTVSSDDSTCDVRGDATCTVEVQNMLWSTCPVSPHWWLPTNLMRGWHWLPFWYAFLVTTHIGGFLATAWQSIIGTALAILAMCILNGLMPGGAGYTDLRAKDTEFGKSGLLPEYNMHLTIILSVSFVHYMCSSSWSGSTIAYCISLFSGVLVAFMNPATHTRFRAILFDYNWDFNWNGPMMCDVYVVLLSIIVTIPGLGIFGGRGSFEKHSAFSNASKGFVKLAADVHGCLEWLIRGFGQDTWNFDTHSSFFYIRELGARRTKIEALLPAASWECWTAVSKWQLQVWRNFANLLRELRQVLRSELEHSRSLSYLQVKPHTEPISEYLVDFLQDSKLAMQTCVKLCRASEKDVKDNVGEIKRITNQSRKHLFQAMEHLRLSDNQNGKSFWQELALLDRLQTWPSLIDAFVTTFEISPSTSAATSSTGDWKERHMKGLRNTVAWFLALLWCVYKRDFTATTIVAVSLLLSSSTGSSFDKNINRIIGVSLGLAFGNLPAALVIGGTVEGVASPQRTIMYLVVMFIMWTVAMYGTLASNSKYSHAYLLWTGIGSVHMMKHVQWFQKSKGLYMELLDNLFAVFIIFAVDLVFAYLARNASHTQVTTTVVSCLRQVESMVKALKEGNFEDLNVDGLRRMIKNARFWHTEMRQESLIWTTLWESPYQNEMVETLLDLCDDVYIAGYTIKASEQRCGKVQAQSIVQDVLRGQFMDRCDLHVRAFEVAVNGGMDRQCLQELLEEPIDLNGHRDGPRSSRHRGSVVRGSESNEDSDLSKLMQQRRKDNRDLSAGRCLDFTRNQADERPSLKSLPSRVEMPEASSEYVAETATLSVRLSCVLVRTTLQRIGGLLAAGGALAAKDWRVLSEVESSQSTVRKDTDEFDFYTQPRTLKQRRAVTD